jgi:hypothetical protein
MRFPHLGLFAGLVLAFPVAAQNLLTNPGFEDGSVNWAPFIPAESNAHSPFAGVVEGFARTGQSALRLSSEVPSRFAFGNYPPIAVTPGQRYRISAWYRVEPGAVVQPGLPGFVLRTNFSSRDAAPGTPAKHLYVGTTGAVSINFGSQTSLPVLPTEWAHIEAVVDVPENVDRFWINLFSWGLAGAFLVDDASVELVPLSVPATPLTDAGGAVFAPRPVGTNAAASAAVPSGPVVPRNIIVENSGFESGIRGWDNLSDSAMSRSTPEAAARGDSGLRVADADPVRGSSLRSAFFPARPGQTFRVNFTARVVSGDGIAVYLQFCDQAKRLINASANGAEDNLMLASGLTEFTPQSLIARAPAGTVAVQIWIHSFTKALVVADFDDFELIENAR